MSEGGSRFGEGTSGLEELTSKPLAMLDNAVAGYTKKAAASFWGKFKRQLSTASEPLLRKDMGERYLSGGVLTGGAAIWFWATVAALAFPDIRSVGAFIGHISALHRLGHWMNNFVPTLLVGGALSLFHYRFGSKNIRLMAKYRADGTAYHTQSHGVSRWEGRQAFVPWGIVAVLILFDLPAGILFVISCVMSAKIASEQQDAIYARYLDALDARIEKEYLESAMLGKCPTEITQLHKPLPESLTADLRKNIAAAAVGKQVEILAQGPRIGGQADTPKAAETPGRPQEPAPSMPRNPRAGAPIRREPQASGFEPPTPKAQQPEAGGSAPMVAREPTQPIASVAQPASQPPAETQPAATDSKYKLLFFGLVIVLMVAVTIGGVVRFWPAKPGLHPTAIAARPAAPARATAAIPQPVAQNDSPVAPPVDPPVVESKPATPLVATTPATIPAVIPEPPATNDPQLLARIEFLQQTSNTLAAESALVADFKEQCKRRMADNLHKIAALPRAERAEFLRRNETDHEILKEILAKENEVLSNYGDALAKCAANQSLNVQGIMEPLKGLIAAGDSSRKKLIFNLDNFDADFSNAPAPSALAMPLKN